MKKYRVLIHGQGFFIRDRDAGITRKLGFYTTVTVEAADSTAAVPKAINLVREDESLRGAAASNELERPLLEAEEVVEVAQLEDCGTPRTGLAFYDMETDDD